jgi:catechol 2,3-dioxygenase-like lactoylglutathione lyase family enzyme
VSDQPAALRGVNHLALVCEDMARTVEFYETILGLKLVKTIELPMGGGQHFFFELGDGSCIAFFWFPDAPAAAPGISAPRGLPTDLDLLSAHGSMNHLAFDVAADRFDAERERLIAAGVACSEVLNHDDSEWGVTRTQREGTFLRSTYFFDPDGILLELACWTAPFGPDAVRHAPARAVAPVES